MRSRHRYRTWRYGTARPAERAACGAVLGAAAVEVLDLQLLGIDAIEAAHVDRGHRLAARAGAARERLDAAGLAERVVNDVLVELVVGQLVLALLELELLDRRERQQRAGAPAHRAVAGEHGLREVELDGVADHSAMTATCIG